MKIVSIIGARPQFIKIAPLVRAIQNHNKSNTPTIKHLIIHTGQHYDYEMNKIFFDELGIPEPDYNLEVGSGPHGWQTGEMIKRTEEALTKERPQWVLVYGDTNSTLAGALAAAKIHMPIAHIEAGLRSYNKKMPEEINRVLADHCSAILFCPTENAVRNLQKEGFTNIINNGNLVDNDLSSLTSPTVINVGDIMYDALLLSLNIAEQKSSALERLKLKPKAYYLATVHRAENTNDKGRLKNIIEALIEISKEKPVIFPVHPRTKKILGPDYSSLLTSHLSLRIIDPVSYLDMLILEKNAQQVLTDSGGAQKEAYLLGVPCITLRDETEWIETIETGWNVLVGTTKERILVVVNEASDQRVKPHKKHPIFGDGGAGKRIVGILLNSSKCA